MAILLKTTSVRVNSIQIMQVIVQNKGKSVWKSRYDGDVSITNVMVVAMEMWTWTNCACIAWALRR